MEELNIIITEDNPPDNNPLKMLITFLTPHPKERANSLIEEIKEIKNALDQGEESIHGFSYDGEWNDLAWDEKINKIARHLSLSKAQLIYISDITEDVNVFTSIN